MKMFFKLSFLLLLLASTGLAQDSSGIVFEHGDINADGDIDIPGQISVNGKPPISVTVQDVEATTKFVYH
uniref:Uncharacterized protein n=1 Tax=Caenorhabditis japonica TaxID=281687 RepID=A0A8R1EQK9_CAEJA